jgi:hypothetical protein
MTRDGPSPDPFQSREVTFCVNGIFLEASSLWTGRVIPSSFTQYPKLFHAVSQTPSHSGVIAHLGHSHRPQRPSIASFIGTGLSHRWHFPTRCPCHPHSLSRKHSFLHKHAHSHAPYGSHLLLSPWILKILRAESGNIQPVEVSPHHQH